MLTKAPYSSICFACQLCAARYADCRHAAFGVVSRAGEHFKLDVFDQVGHVHQLQRVTQVRLVGAKATHRFGEGHDREIAQIHALHIQPQLARQFLHHFTHLIGGHEGGFDVDLGEFRLTVRT